MVPLPALLCRPSLSSADVTLGLLLTVKKITMDKVEDAV